jgi:hypothetical protein
MREPTGHSPEEIWARRAEMTCSDRAERRGEVRGIDDPSSLLVRVAAGVVRTV